MKDDIDQLLEQRDVTMTGTNPEPLGLRDRLAYAAGLIGACPVRPSTPSLLYRGPGDRVALVPLAGRVVVGRRDPATVVVPCEHLSRQHFDVACSADGEALLSDLGSKNGTLVNGVRSSGSIRLVAGDLIEAGSLVFLYWAP
jgi:hypothetical protein